jgi:hypothetical protein
MNAEQDAAALAEALEELHRKFIGDGEPPGDVIAAWEAIERLARLNKRREGRGEPPFPMPGWINDYLLRSADKIRRLSLGIPPEDDRRDIPIDEIGVLRKVRHADGGGAERFRDERLKHVAPAMGFAAKGWTAFQRHDRAEDDALFLRIHDDPDLKDNKVLRTNNKALRTEVRQSLYGVIAKQEGLGDGAIRNRLSAARTASKKRGGV